MKYIFLLLFTTSIFSSQIYYEYGEKVQLVPHTLKKSESLTKGNNSIKYYKKSNSQIVGVDNTIIAKCIDKSECERIILKYSSLKFEIISKNIYLIYLKNQEEIFDISVKLYEEGCFLYVHPNFYKEKRLR